MPVYRPYPHPQQPPKIAPLIPVAGQVALESMVAGRGSVVAITQTAIALSARVVGSTKTLAGLNAARDLLARVSGSTASRAAANVARAIAVKVSGSARTLANSIVARALAVRSVGASAVLNAIEGGGAVTARVWARASVVGSLIASRALETRISGRGLTRAGQIVAYALSSMVSGRTRARGGASAAYALSARVAGKGATLANQAVGRALNAVIRAGASARSNLPPTFVEVVGIIRRLLRASMRRLEITATAARVPIMASGRVRIPIVVSAENMIAKNVTLKGFVIGDDTEIAFELTEWPAGVLLAKAYFTMKKSLKDLDPAAVIQRDITSALTAEGQITANGSLGTAEGYFLIRHQDAEWANVKPDLSYFFDIQPITDQATVQTPIVGTISFIKGRTDAAS